MDTNDEKINNVLGFGQKLCDEDHYAADKINKKCESIEERLVLHKLNLIPRLKVFLSGFRTSLMVRRV